MTVRPPLVSVLLVTHDHARFVERAMASIEGQDVAFPLEVVVADDASTDGTRETLERWAASSALSIRVLAPAPRCGTTLNYARAFPECGGRYIAVLEGDDEWIRADKLRLQAAHLETHPAHTLVATRILHHDEIDRSTRVLPEIGLGQRSSPLTVQRLAELNWFATFSCCMYRASAVQGISREIFSTTAYDWLVNLAVLEHGPAGLLPQVMTLYRRHAGGRWSGGTERERDVQLRDLLPRYIELSSPRVGRELTRTLHQLEARLASGGAAGPPRSAPAAAMLPVPRVGRERAPRVSVVMGSFDHERWVAEAVASVLGQTMSDLELIVVDDASVDRTASLVASVDDPRLRLYRLGSNQGGAAALNLAIQQARGELVAVINSDDAWEPHKLERQLSVLDAQPEVGAVFTGARVVGEDGRPLPPHEIPLWHSVFRQPNRSQAQWLRHLLEHGNALCHPSLLIRRRFYEEHGFYDNRLRQLPDFERWIALVKQCPIRVLGDEDLVRFRVLRRQQNASSPSRANSLRAFREHLVVAERFFDGCSDALLVEAFGDLLIDPHFSTPQQRECEIAFLWWQASGPLQEINRLHALRAFRRLLGDPDTALLLRGRYGFTDRDLHERAGEELGELAALLAPAEAVAASEPTPVPSTADLLREIWLRMRREPLWTWPARTVRQLRRA